MLRGTVRIGKRTKELVKELNPSEIAIIDHQDLDAMGASGLVEAKVAAVINGSPSITGKYPNLGPQILAEANIPLLDNVGSDVLEKLKDGDTIEIRANEIFLSGQVIASGVLLSKAEILNKMTAAEQNLDQEIARFVDNTISYAQKEKSIILGKMCFPKTKCSMEGKHVVVVVRGIGYREDLEAILSFIDEMKPVLIAVDGGADVILEFKRIPHIIIGDMDSVSDKALRSGAELIVHAYQDGRCPGKTRLDELGLDYSVMPAPGTSEDVALLLAHEHSAELIVIVGSHSNLIDFLEKGRPGMASTFLTRVKIGPRLLDAKGLSKLYQSRSGVVPVPLVLAALVSIMLFLAIASPWRHFFRLIWLQIRVYLGGM